MSDAPPAPHSPSSEPGDEGVRVHRKPTGPAWRGETRVGLGVLAIAVIGVAGSLLIESSRDRPGGPAVDPQPRPMAAAAPASPTADPAAPAGRALPPSWTQDAAPVHAPLPQQGDPNDLAAYLRPGDPEPSMANVIRALNEAGIRTGIGAFNPPGTSPPLEGLAVPADFVLPEGYVRHHQVTDEGEPIEAILMFAPDAVMRDARGRPITLPADRVVPPELAPIGLPIRRVRI